MAQLVINVGASPNDGQGDPIRTSFIKCNTNFSELFSRVQTSPPPTLVGSPGDVPGMYAYDENYFYYCFDYYDGSSEIWGQLSSESPTQLLSGTSNVQVGNSANITMSVAGVSNVVTVSSAGIDASNITLTGDLMAVNLVGSGNLSVTGTTNLTGNVTSRHILPAANVTYDLGSPTAQWGNIYVGGNTIYLGDATLTADATSMTLTTGSGAEFVIGGTGGNAEGTFGNLEVTGAITADNIDLTGDGNVAGNVTAGYFIGDGSFLTNITAFANVAVTQIANGTSIIDIDGLNGYARVQVGGVGNVGVFTPSGLYVTGLTDVTGALTAGSMSTAGAITATGNVTGGNISTAATVAGATLVANASTAATSTTTGSLRTAGGLGVAGNAYIGGLITATGNITGGNLTTAGTMTAATVSASGNISTTDGFSGANLVISGQANITGTTAATSTTTGSLKTSGGLGVAGNAFIGGIANVAGNINGANLSINNLASISYIDVISRLDIKASAESTSTITGAVIVAGGIGAGGNVYVGQQVVATGNITGGNLSGTNITGTLSTAAQPNITSVGTLSSLTVTGNISGGNLITSGVLSVNSGGAVTGIVNAAGNGVGNIGSSTTYFNTVFAKATSAQYADLAECYLADQEYAPGTVVKFGGTQEVTLANQDHDPEIAGVVSTNPAYLMNTAIQGPNIVAVALAGRVPCLVRGPVRRGQMMVSAGDGHARAETNPSIGTVIGKALEDFNGKQGTIEIVVGRL